MATDNVPNDRLETGLAGEGYSQNRFILFHAESPSSLDFDNLREAIVGSKVRGSHFREMRRALNLTVEEIASVLGSSLRTISRKERGRNTLSPTEADRVYRLARVADLAVESNGDAGRAALWLSTPSTYLGNRTPLQMLDTELGTTYVERSLAAIAYGGIA